MNDIRPHVGCRRLPASPRLGLIALAMLLPLAACGGGSNGSGGGTTTPPPTLTITSGETATIKENTSGTVYSASATLSNGAAVTFAIVGGADAGSFTIQSDGRLRFNQAPDFERPADADADNVYEVTIRASGGGVTKNFNVAVTVTNDKEGIAVTRIATGFSDPVCIDFLNEKPAPTAGPQGRIAVGEKGGKIYEIDGTTGTRTELANVFAGRTPAEVIECKSFLRQRTWYYAGLYAAIREPDGRVWMQRYDRTGLAETQLLPSGTPQTGIALINGPDDEFYLAVGDVSGSSAQSSTSPLGKLFQLLQRDPYAGASLSPGYFTPSMIGKGLRDPGGGSAVDGRILLSDRGATAQHELSFFYTNERPLDFGWPSREGTEPMANPLPPVINGPTVVYPVGSGPRQGTGIVSGWTYGGPATELKDRYIFGDKSGLIWSIPMSVLTDGKLHNASDLENRTADFTPDVGTIDSPVGFATDDLGRFYILDSDGEVFRVDGS